MSSLFLDRSIDRKDLFFCFFFQERIIGKRNKAFLVYCLFFFPFRWPWKGLNRSGLCLYRIQMIDEWRRNVYILVLATIDCHFVWDYQALVLLQKTAGVFFFVYLFTIASFNAECPTKKLLSSLTNPFHGSLSSDRKENDQIATRKSKILFRDHTVLSGSRTDHTHSRILTDKFK